MKRISADYIYTACDKPLKNGVVVVNDQGQILQVEKERRGDEEVYKGVICPGFVNVHCHVELSFAKNKIEKSLGIDSFINQLEKLKRFTPDEDKIKSTIFALLEMESNGIVAVGDIMNTPLSFYAKDNSVIQFYNFIETFGAVDCYAEKRFSEAMSLYEKTKGLKNIVPHAPYSLSSNLFEKIKEFQSKHNVLSIHHMESIGEAELFRNGEGLMADRFKLWGLKLPSFIPSGKRPIETIGNYFTENERVLLIHNTFVNEEDIMYVKNNFKNTFWGLCPRANLFIENKLPPVDLLYDYDLSICLGTDSYASNDSLSIFEEIKILHENFDFPFEVLVRWATINGAKALGMENTIGTIERGKTPGLVLLEYDDTNDFLQFATRLI